VTTAAQYFHLVRLQAATLSGDRRPLVLFTPKSLLRHPRSASTLDDLANGSFQPVLDDPREPEPDRVRRVIFVTGKAGIDLLDEVGENDQVAIVRIELLYPFPTRDVRDIVDRYANAGEHIWLQEEPRNMGAWMYVQPRLNQLLPSGSQLTYVGRPERASTAEGSASNHAREQARIISQALDTSGETPEREERGVQHVR
jgi:2-oxoglutarate dehydrogenase E1 component